MSGHLAIPLQAAAGDRGAVEKLAPNVARRRQCASAGDGQKFNVARRRQCASTASVKLAKKKLGVADPC